MLFLFIPCLFLLQERFLNAYEEEAKRLSSRHLAVMILLLTSVCI